MWKRPNTIYQLFGWVCNKIHTKVVLTSGANKWFEALIGLVDISDLVCLYAQVYPAEASITKGVRFTNWGAETWWVVYASGVPKKATDDPAFHCLKQRRRASVSLPNSLKQSDLGWVLQEAWNWQSVQWRKTTTKKLELELKVRLIICRLNCDYWLGFEKVTQKSSFVFRSPVIKIKKNYLCPKTSKF